MARARLSCLAGDCVHLGRLVDGDVAGNILNHHVDNHGQGGGEEGRDDVVVGVVLVHLDQHADQETDGIHPCNRGGEGETSHNCVEGLGLDLSGEVQKSGRSWEIVLLGRHLY